MKWIITLSFSLLSTIALQAQNPMFCGFESQFGGVLSWLEAKSNLEITEQIPNKSIVVAYNEAVYGYHFNRGILYEIRMQRVFATKKEGKEAYEGCMRYFKMISPKGSEFKNGKGRSCQIREARGRLYDLELHQLEGGHEVFELILTAKDPRLMPFEEHDPKDSRFFLDEFLTHEYLLQSIGNQKLNFL
ncbi:MAG: hypothetical protein AAFN10_25745 [Bacteroidota bacterium]